MKSFITKQLYKEADQKFFTQKLLQWNMTTNIREMPWKGEKDPYKIWLSEIILQQTRVEQGWDYYNRFIKFFPDIKKLAKASDESVFKLWEGLGYYTRCKNLLATARKIVDEYQGKFPESYDEIKKLKGVGPYTAAAIASFAYNLPYAVVDGNVMRLLSRFFGIETPIDSTAGKKLFQQLALACLPPTQAGLYNQAIMDFGAVVCKPQNPSCTVCPFVKKCRAFKKSQIASLPVKEKSIRKTDRWFYFLIIKLGQKFYVRKRTEKDIWQNLFEYVTVEIKEDMDTTTFLRSAAFKKMAANNKFEVKETSKLYRQQLSHQTIHGRFLLIEIKKEWPCLKTYQLLNEKQIRELPFPRMLNQWHSKAG
jgi:A/G-specific adenine glycosylase